MRTQIATVLTVLLVVGCGDGPPTTPDSPAYQPDWRETRHAHVTVSTQDDKAVLRVEPSPGAPERPPRLLVLCNVDDDDGQGVRDCENDVIDGQRDASDLARVELGPLRGCSSQRVAVRVEDASAIRLFDAEGTTRVGPEAGATWTLPPEVLQKLEAGRVRVYVEGCAFGSKTEVELVVDGEVLAEAILEVAPLLLAPPGTPAESIFITRKADEVPGSDCYFGRFAEAHELIANETPPGMHCPPLLGLVVSGETYDSDMWIQDAMQWAYTRTPFAYLPVAVRMPYGKPLRLWAEGLLGPDIGTVRPSPWPDYQVQPVSLAYGGNLEAGAASAIDGHGCILHGFRAGEFPMPDIEHDKLARLRQFFDEAARQRLLEIDTSWLSVGHVDEIVSFVPNPDLDGGVVVLVASPGDAIAILEKVAGSPVPEEFADRHWQLAQIPDDVAQQGGEPDLLWKYFLEASVRGCDQTSLTSYNLAIERRLFGDDLDPSEPAALRPLLDAIAEAGLEMVKVPVLFYRLDDAVDGFTHATALLPNSVNLVPVGERLLAPDPMVAGFKTALTERFGVDWIETFDFLHSERGGLHCVTNVQPKCPEKAWWRAGR